MQEGAQDYLIKGQIIEQRARLLRALRYAVERKIMEEALFVEKERAQVTLNCIGDAVICTDVSGNITFLNPVAEKLTGWSLARSGGPADGRSFPNPGRHESRSHSESDGDGSRPEPNRAPAVELHPHPA